MHLRSRTISDSDLWQLSHRLPLADCRRAVESAGATSRTVPAARGADTTALFLAVGCSSRRICDLLNTELSIVAIALKEIPTIQERVNFIFDATHLYYCSRRM